MISGVHIALSAPPVYRLAVLASISYHFSERKLLRNIALTSHKCEV